MRVSQTGIPEPIYEIKLKKLYQVTITLILKASLSPGWRRDLAVEKPNKPPEKGRSDYYS